MHFSLCLIFYSPSMIFLFASRQIINRLSKLPENACNQLLFWGPTLLISVSWYNFVTVFCRFGKTNLLCTLSGIAVFYMLRMINQRRLNLHHSQHHLPLNVLICLSAMGIYWKYDVSYLNQWIWTNPWTHRMKKNKLTDLNCDRPATPVFCR